MQNIFLLYDGIKNSVFESQVLEPLKKSNQKYLIVSFEKTIINKHKLPKTNNQIKIIQIKKTSYFGKLSLFWPMLKLKILQLTSTNIIARGPFAGYIAQKCFKKRNLIIQARGLVSEEYDYTFEPKNFIQKLIKKIRTYQFKSLEKEVYSNKKIKIETVSNALKNFLIKNYNANKNNITIAKLDIPQQILAAKKKSWKKEIREFLKIDQDKTVYAYSGSTHKWQCPERTIEYFKQKLNQEKNAHLLILSKNINEFELLIKKHNLLKHSTITSCNPNEVIKFLSAADYGIILREKHILNWVSRPTKALEYRAAHLKIIHNNTVEFLKNF